MRVRRYPWGLESLYTGRPTVGGLMDLCEENFAHLLRLAPDLRKLEGRYLSPLSGEVDLHLEILEQTRYTTLLRLTYYFAGAQQQNPDALIRVYHDARQAEVMDLQQRVVVNTGLPWPPLAHKWKLNLFLSKWLSYCVRQGHLFEPKRRVEDPSESSPTLVTSC